MKKICTRCEVKKKRSEFYTSSVSRDGLHSWCKVCSRVYDKARRESVAGKEYSRVYDKARGESVVRQEYKRIRSSEYYEINKERYRSRAAVYYAANKESRCAYDKAYRKTDAGKEANHRGMNKRRATKRGATIGPIDEAAVYEFCGGKCVYCGSKEKLSLDHVVALVAGGSHTQNNLVVACKSCNSSKGAKPVVEWLATRPKTLSLSIAL